MAGRFTGSPRGLPILEVDASMSRKPAYTMDVVIASDPIEARRVQDEIEAALLANKFSEKEIFGIRLALEEALVNAIKHGNNLDKSKSVHISYGVKPERFDISIRDEGPGFDPCDVPDPTDVENLERPCGRGLMLMRHYMNEVSFGPRGNPVLMSKLRNGSF
jgi:serine/threonine-protein kinase RsbW